MTAYQGSDTWVPTPKIHRVLLGEPVLKPTIKTHA